MLVSYSGTLDLSWSVVDVTQCVSTREDWFSLSKQPSTVEFLSCRWDFEPTSPLQARILFDFHLCKFCLCFLSLWGHMSIDPVVAKRHCLLRVIYHLWVLHYSSSTQMSESWETEVWWRHHCPLVGFCVYTHLLAWSSFYDEGWVRYWFTGIHSMTFGVLLLLLFFLAES